MSFGPAVPRSAGSHASARPPGRGPSEAGAWATSGSPAAPAMISSGRPRSTSRRTTSGTPRLVPSPTGQSRFKTRNVLKAGKSQNRHQSEGASMKTKAAVVYEPGKRIEIEELDLDGPKDGEVLIRYTHAGLCHSDIHIAHGDLPARLPMVLGHEGAGIIEEIGPGVTRVKAGDKVVCSFIPNCGVCRYCATGRQSICDMGATILEGYLPGPRFPMTGPRGQYGAMCMIG